MKTKQIKKKYFSKSQPNLENPQKGHFDNSSKNLANFFNGEIVDLDE